MLVFIRYALVICLWLGYCVNQAWAEPLRVCTMDNDAPFSSRSPSKTWEGFVIELWNALDIGQPYEFIATNLPLALAGLEDGSCHIVASNISITPQRQQRFLFSTPYMHTGLGALVLADTQNIQTSTDLRDKTIVTIKGTSSEQYIMDTIKSCILIVLPSEKETLNALMQGKADVLIFDTPTLHRIANTNKNVTVLFEELYPQEYAFAIPKKATALRDTVNAGLERLHNNGTIRTLIEKWFKAQN